MTGLEKIEAKIISDAKNKANEIIKNARDEAGKITDDATREAEAYRTESMAKASAEGKRASERAVSAAKLEAKKLLLSAKQNIMDECFSKARQKILSMPLADYEELLIEWIITAADTGAEKLVLSHNDAQRISLLRFIARINAKLAAQGGKPGITLSEETINAEAGFLLKRDDIVINCTLDAMLNSEREKLESELAAVLF